LLHRTGIEAAVKNVQRKRREEMSKKAIKKLGREEKYLKDILKVLSSDRVVAKNTKFYFFLELKPHERLPPLAEVGDDRRARPWGALIVARSQRRGSVRSAPKFQIHTFTVICVIVLLQSDY
jgi:hypothetical protein